MVFVWLPPQHSGVLYVWILVLMLFLPISRWLASRLLNFACGQFKFANVVCTSFVFAGFEFANFAFTNLSFANFACANFVFGHVEFATVACALFVC